MKKEYVSPDVEIEMFLIHCEDSLSQKEGIENGDNGEDFDNLEF